jgi:O-acetylserine/cysteine efflux transporter
VPLSKLSLPWLAPGWLAVLRFGVAAPLLILAGRRGLRSALTPSVLAAGGLGFGAVILLQNAGVERTSVSHASLLLGTVPVLVALISAGAGQGRGTPSAWGGYGLALGGIALVAGSGGSGASLTGDLLVLASAALSAVFIVLQSRLLQNRDPAAVTGVQFAAAAVVSLPVAAATGPLPAAPSSLLPVLALIALALLGTLLPFWLFAYGQTRVSAHLAGAFVNLEPVVGAAVGWLAFGNPAAPVQVSGALAVLAGIVVSARPPRTRNPQQARAGTRESGGRSCPDTPCRPARPPRLAPTRPRARAR